MKKLYILFILAAFCFNLQGAFPDLNRATRSLGGNVAILSKIELTSKYYMDIDLRPSISYILNYWEIGGRPNLNLSLFRPYKMGHTLDWGLAIFVRRYFLYHEICTLYAGANSGARIFDSNLKSFKGTLGAEVGVLIGLNEFVAIDIGLPITAHFDSMSIFNRLEFPLGFWGLKAFF